MIEREPRKAKRKRLEQRFFKTDIGNAQRLVSRFGSSLRFAESWGKWLTWDGRRWTTRQTLAHELAKQNAREIYGEAVHVEDSKERRELVRHAEASQSASRIRAALFLARSEPGVLVEIEELDANPWLLNCENGIVDLQTGSLRPHDRNALLTKLCPTPFIADAECPTWLQFLNGVFAGDADLIAYLQSLLGYCLTGDVREQKLPIFWGAGANGKSTLLNAVLETLGGDYAMKAPSNLLMVRGNDAHPTELTDLHGKRLVAAVETESGRRLSETLVKELTGSDRIRARRMREDFWEFAPSHKLVLCTNHKPEVRGTDHAIWRRLDLVPFGQTFSAERQDRKLPQKLQAEYPGILAWCVRGCLAWQADGLPTPGVVSSATTSYRDEQDALGTFLGECCMLADDCKVKSADLYAAYKSWCDVTGESVLKQRQFGERITERGHQRYKNVVVWYRGIGLINGTTGGCGT